MASRCGNRSLLQLRRPDLADSLQLPLNAAAGQPQPLADFLVRVAFELALGDLAKAIIIEQ